MKSNKNCIGLYFILLLISSNLIHFSQQLKSLDMKNLLEVNIIDYFQNEKYKTVSPDKILQFTESEESSELDKKMEMSIKGIDPIKYLELKRDFLNLVTPKSNKKTLRTISSGKANTNNSYSFKQNIESNYDDSTTAHISPDQIGKMGYPSNKEYNNDEEVVPIYKVKSSSNYIKNNDDIEQSFSAENVLIDNYFWCSSGQHGINEPIKFLIEFNRSYRINAMWIHWAFAPGKYQINYSNDDEVDPLKKNWTVLIPMTYSYQDGDINWWKSVLSNPKSRWKYKSFDSRVDFNEPIWAKFIEIILIIPVNQYYGIYKLEFYTKTKSIVMIKSREPGEDICLASVNGMIADYSPLIAISCLQAIGYGDNRDLLVINSNGYITSFKGNKCVESPNPSSVDFVECGTAANYKDDREKWILDYDGKIRSSKEPYTCLSLQDESFGDSIPSEFVVVKASSKLNDSIHDPSKVLDYDSHSFWCSSLSKTHVIFEVYFPKCPFIIKEIIIDWKFPAKKFKVIGLLPDNYWKEFMRNYNNDSTRSVINLSNYDILGIKIQMIESTTKFEEHSIYAITTLSFHTGGKFIRREPCKEILYSVNLWELIDINVLDNVTSFEKQKAQSELHKTKTKFQIMTVLYEKIPDSLLRMKERSSFIRKNIFDLHSSYEDTQNKIIRFLDFLHDEKVTLYTLAANEYFPAYDCASIIKAFPSKRSGFYWIKNECNPQPYRVFCDFDSINKKTGLDYYVYNGNQVINTPIHNIKNIKDVRLLCGKLGFEPIHIKNQNILLNIKKLLLKMGYNLKDKTIIPLAYDYNCDIAKCSGLYKSLNSGNSNDVNEFLKDNRFEDDGIQYDYTKNIFEDSGEIIRNVAAFGINNRISYVKLEDYPVAALICSTNKDGSKIENKTVEIDCETNLRGDLFENYELYTNLRLECPRNCASEPYPIYGTALYTDNSSICRAAIHSGIIKDSEGGKIEINLEPGKNSYIGSSAFNIDSLDYSNEWDRSFRVKKYIPYCPIDKIKEYEKAKHTSSFLEIGQELEMNNNEKLEEISDSDSKVKVDFNLLYNILKNNRELIKSLNDKNHIANTNKDTVQQNNKNKPKITEGKKKELKKYFNGFMKFLQLLDEESHSSNLENPSKIGSFKSESKGFSLNEIQELIKNNQVQKRENSDNMSNNNEKSNIVVEKLINNKKSVNGIIEQNIIFNKSVLPSDSFHLVDSKKSTNDLIVYKPPKRSQTTEEAIIAIKTIRQKEINSIIRVKKIANEFKTLVGKAVFHTKILTNDKELGLNSQKKVLAQLTTKINEIQKKIYEINRKCHQRMTKTEEHLKLAKAKINSFMKRDQFVEDYSSKNILDNYEIFNSKKGSGLPSKWNYYMYNLNGHLNTIMQKDSLIDNRTGSHLIIKNRDFYDFEMKFSVMIKDKHTFGVAFRYKDPYNYYIFEMSTQDKGYKKVSKYLKGSETMIDIKYDGGYMIDTWYNIKIRGKQSLFQIYLTDQAVEIEKKYELIFEFTDNQLVHGTVAFASQGLNFLLLDNINIIPIPCTNLDSKEHDNHVVITPTCPRFNIILKRDVLKDFKIIDPLKPKDGPSLWSRLENVEDRESLLFQNSLISSKNDSEEGTFLILNDQTKICTKGRISLKFKAMDDGIVGIIFRYSEKGDLYILEISGEKEKFIRMRKRIDGVFSLVSQHPLNGYVKNRWYRIVIFMKEQKFNLYMTQQYMFESLNKVFDEDIEDSDLKFGLLGLSTYKTRAYFEEISLSPFDDLEDHDNLVYVEEDNLDVLKYNYKKTNYLIANTNKNIKNFSWQKCLSYPIKEDRIRFCDVLFHSKYELDKCKKNFCESCCQKSVDITNHQHIFICSKQCKSIEMGNYQENSYDSCYEPTNPETSIYPYCDKLYENDFYQRSQCKIDMCNLCCISFDSMKNTNLPNTAINNCYSQCIKKFDKRGKPGIINLRNNKKIENEITKLFKAKNIYNK